MKLRSHLVILVAASLVPVIALAVVLILRAHQSNRAAVERGMRETVRAMAFAVDREIGIALTAYGRTEDRMRTLSAGYNMHVPKPVDPGELTTIVASVAGRPAGR